MPTKHKLGYLFLGVVVGFTAAYGVLLAYAWGLW